MPARTVMRSVIAVALLVIWFPQGSIAQGRSGGGGTPEAVRTHVGHVADAFADTPEGRGLLPTAIMEAEIVARHATLAGGDTSNLDAMKLHAGHVLHAIDPTVMASGPGLGYGLKRAAEGVVRHARLAEDTEGASTVVKARARSVRTPARNTVERADSIVVLAQQIREATSAAAAAELLGDLTEITDVLIPGRDANNDGGIGWRRGEGGLEQARQYLATLKREAGMES